MVRRGESTDEGNRDGKAKRGEVTEEGGTLTRVFMLVFSPCVGLKPSSGT